MAPKLYLVMVDSPLDGDTFTRLLSLVRAEKRERIIRQKIKQNADAMLVGELLAQKAIQKVFGIAFAEQKIACTKHGKPYLENHPQAHFNISHSGDCVVCAVCDVPVGVDVQKIVDYNPRIARKVCNENELELLKNSEDASSAFSKLWSQKEAVVKLNGTGIAGAGVKNCLAGRVVRSTKFENYWVSVAI